MVKLAHYLGYSLHTIILPIHEIFRSANASLQIVE